MGKEQDCKTDLAMKKCQTELLEIKNQWHSKEGKLVGNMERIKMS